MFKRVKEKHIGLTIVETFLKAEDLLDIFQTTTMDFSNKENVFRLRLYGEGTETGKDTKSRLLKRETSEQLRAFKKQKIPSESEGIHRHNDNATRQRVPLGGKDQNLSIPTHQRSQSSGFSFNDGKQQRKKVLPKIPQLEKANSTLETGRSDVRRTEPVRQKLSYQRSVSDTLSPKKANRSMKLTQEYDTDSLVKRQNAVGYENLKLEKNLESTLTNQVDLLNARNILDIDANKTNADPIKRKQKSISTEADAWLDAHPDLLDEGSIQVIPSKPSSQTNDKYGIEPLNDEILQKLRKDSPDRQDLDIFADSNQDFGIEDVELHMSSLDGENESCGLQKSDDLPTVGMSVDDMYGLLG